MTNTLLSNPASTTAYFLLMIAISSLWINSRMIVWISLLTGATLAALVADRITITGIFAFVIFGIVCFSFYRLKLNPFLRFVLGSVITLFCLLFGTHKFPGFNNWLILPDFTLSPDDGVRSFGRIQRRAFIV